LVDYVAPFQLAVLFELTDDMLHQLAFAADRDSTAFRVAVNRVRLTFYILHG
jgi:hypothetical protein